MTYSFATSEVEDGTGKATAQVYEQPSVGITWLNARGKTSFSAASDAAQQAAALRAVEECEDELMSLGFRGARVAKDQGLLLPARGAYDQEGDMYDPDDLPSELLEAIRLTEEEIAAGTWMPSAGNAAIKRVKAPGAEVEYAAGSDAGSISGNHPEIYRRLRRVVP